MIFGYIALTIVLLAFVSLNTKYSKHFLIIDAIGTFFFVIHSIIIFDIPFIIAQVLIMFMLIKKQIKGGIE